MESDDRDRICYLIDHLNPFHHLTGKYCNTKSKLIFLLRLMIGLTRAQSPEALVALFGHFLAIKRHFSYHLKLYSK